MAKRRSFNKKYLQQESDKLTSKINKPITMFLLGGGAMTFYGVKDATKNIDIILINQEKLKTLTTALKSLDYKNPDSVVITRINDKMRASEILENADGFRWDIFVKKVCNALTSRRNENTGTRNMG
jgi:pantothenate kinase